MEWPEDNTSQIRCKIPQLQKLVQLILIYVKPRSEEHTSELQSLRHLVCRLLLEKKKKLIKSRTIETSDAASGQNPPAPTALSFYAPVALDQRTGYVNLDALSELLDRLLLSSTEP